MSTWRRRGGSVRRTVGTLSISSVSNVRASTTCSRDVCYERYEGRCHVFQISSYLGECQDFLAISTATSKFDAPDTETRRLGASSCPIGCVIEQVPIVRRVPSALARLNDFHRFCATYIPNCKDTFLRCNSKLQSVTRKDCGELCSER